MRLGSAILLGPLVLGSACKDEDEEALTKADALLPKAVAFVDALLTAQASDATPPACEGSVPLPTLLFTQERLDSLRKGTGGVSMHPEWEPADDVHPCYMKYSMDSVQTVDDYRSRTLSSYVKGHEVLRAVEDSAECHAELKSFVVFRRGAVEDAKLVGEHAFDPGSARGTLRVFEPDGSPRCTIPVSAISDEEIRVDRGESKQGKEFSLEVDLKINLEDAALEAMGPARLKKTI